MIKTFADLIKIALDISDDAALLSEAQDFVSKLSRRANVRLKALEDKDLTASPAYRRAEMWLKEDSRRRFTESKKLDAESLLNQAQELNAFLNAEESTITGEMQRRSGLDRLMTGATKKEKNQMRRFLESSAFEEMKKTIGTDIVKKAADAIESGARVSDLNRLYKQFLKQESQGKQEMDLLDVWDAWIGE